MIKLLAIRCTGCGHPMRRFRSYSLPVATEPHNRGNTINQLLLPYILRDKNVYPICPDNYRDKGNKVELIIAIEFVLTANKVKVQISFQVGHKLTLA